jgi:tRNA threonylcarbamoyladenosine biosynthesis protein TsaB
MILAIDTSTAQASVAVVEGLHPRAELSWNAGTNHSMTLFPSIDIVLRLGGTTLGDVTALVVAAGPGSFSGLRVGISAAKGLAFARDIPLVGVPTLDAAALEALRRPGEVMAVLPAGRGQVYCARYALDPAGFRRVSDYMILAPEKAAEEAGGAPLVGEGAQLVAAARGDDARGADVPDGLRHAAYLAELGSRYLASGGADQRDVLEPLYLRRSAAEEKRTAAASE